MTPETREELARAIEPQLDIAEMLLADPMTLKRLKAERIARAIALIIERMVAERVAAETERCAGIAEDHGPSPDWRGEHLNKSDPPTT